MKKRRIIFWIALALAIGYVIFFPKKIEQEIYLRPAWKRNLADGIQAGGEDPGKGDRIPFFTGDYFGYVSDSGRLLYGERVQSGVTYGKDFYINYSSVSENLIVKNTDGEIMANLSTRGYPVIRGDRIFVFDEDRCGISEWDIHGSLLWHRRFSLLITAFDCSKTSVLLGFLNGELILVDGEGNISFRELPTGSKYRIIYGAALSSDDSMFAVLLGVEPQRVLLYGRFEGSFRPVHTLDLDSDYRREAFLQFSDDGSFLFIEQPEELLRLDTKSRRTASYHTGQSPTSVSYDRRRNLLFICSGTGKNQRIDLFTLTGMLVTSLRFGKEVSLVYRDSSLYCSYRNEIAKFSLRGGT